MTDGWSPAGRDRSVDEVGLPRRSVLAMAGVGVAGLAGCGSLPFGGGEEAVELDASAIGEIAAGDEPAVVRPLPVTVTDAHVTASRERAQSMLDGVPLPLSADELPNGAMREDIHGDAESARESLTRASDAPGTRSRLDALRDARESTRVVDAAWAYANDDVALADVREAARTVRDETRQFRESREYVGDDPVRAVLVHAVVESWAGDARRHATLHGDGDPRVHGDPPVVNALVVGRRAGSVELARAHLSDARHVVEQFTGSLSDPRSLRSTVDDAQASLSGTIESRVADLPDQDADLGDLVDASVEETVAGETLRRLHGGLPFEGAVEDDDGPAGAVVEQCDALATVGGFEWLRDQVEDGERFRIESASDVRSLRSAAVTAVEDALDASDHPRLARTVLAPLAGWIEYVDRDLERYGDDGTISASSLRSDVGGYVEIAAIANATSEAVAETVDALGA